MMFILFVCKYNKLYCTYWTYVLHTQQGLDTRAGSTTNLTALVLFVYVFKFGQLCKHIYSKQPLTIKIKSLFFFLQSRHIYASKSLRSLFYCWHVDKLLFVYVFKFGQLCKHTGSKQPTTIKVKRKAAHEAAMAACYIPINKAIWRAHITCA